MVLGMRNELETFQEIIGYRRSLLRTFFTWCAIVLTLGGLRLVFHWRRHWMLVCTHTKTSLMNAEKVLLVVSAGKGVRW